MPKHTKRTQYTARRNTRSALSSKRVKEEVPSLKKSPAVKSGAFSLPCSHENCRIARAIMNTNYIYYNEISQEWEPITLEELAMRDDESTLICPLNEDGTPGNQLTYAELLKQTAPKQNTPAKALKPIPVPPPTPEPAPAPEEQPTTEQKTISLSPELENTILYTCRLVTFFFWLSYYIAVIMYFGSLPFVQGIILILLAVIFHFVISNAYLTVGFKNKKKK